MRNIFLLIQGQFFSALGTGIFTLATVLYFKDLSMPAKTISLIFIFSQLPNSILSPFTGTIIDRISKKKLFICSDLIAFAITITLYFSFDYIPYPVPCFISITFLLAIFSGFLAPAVYTYIAESKEINLSKYNRIFESLSKSAFILANLVAALAYQEFGIKNVILFNAITYLISATSELFIKEHKKATSKNESRVLTDIELGLKYFLKSRALRQYSLMSALLNFVICSVPLIIPYYIDYLPGATSKDIGFFYAFNMLGMIVGAIIYSKISNIFPKISSQMIFSFILIGLSFILLISKSYVFLSYSYFLMFGLGVGVINISSITTLQKNIAPSFMGRTLTILLGFSGILMPISFFLVGVIIDSLTDGILILLIINILASFAVALFVNRSKTLKEYFDS